MKDKVCPLESGLEWKEKFENKAIRSLSLLQIFNDFNSDITDIQSQTLHLSMEIIL